MVNFPAPFPTHIGAVRHHSPTVAIADLFLPLARTSPGYIGGMSKLPSYGDQN